MDILITTLLLILTLVGGLAAVGLAALHWGVDTRPRLADDHRR